ncbi:sce7726 family protein [Pseudomonas brassicacearum]|uniref:sce7726 family protein n=1 Tax=Pseudomonas brassicacearum TaxID=930166 RepID=UPI003D6A824E
MRETEIKRALTTHLGSTQACMANLFLEELELNGGEVRADLVDVHEMHCYEIKSETDSLRRLIGQGSRYARVFDRITLVTAERHLKKALPLLPLWWGIMVVPGTEEGAFKMIRAAKPNKRHEPQVLASLLKREEALRLLGELGLVRGWKSKSLYLIHAHLADMLSVEELRTQVRSYLIRRAEGIEHFEPDLFNTVL